MNIGDRIRIKREELGYTQEELAKKIGYKSRSSVNKIEKSRILSNKKVELFAKVLNVSPSYLMGWDTDFNNEKSKGVKIPVLGTVAAGIPIEAIEDILDYEEISEDMARKGDYFALKINGNSMFPRICNNDVVIVRQQSDIESGDIAIVLVNGDNATCKKLLKKETGLMLMPLNREYEPTFFDWKEVEELPVKVIGKVVELRGKF